MTALITVRSGYDDSRVVLWERSPDHPDGELFVAGPAPKQAALTPAVQRKLASGALVEVQPQRETPVKVLTDAPPWPGYQDMTAGEIMTYLAAVPVEKQVEVNDSVRRYEELHKGRKTILEVLG